MNTDLQKTYQKFQEQANNLATATGPTFDSALNSFLNFCETDALMSEISKPVRSGPSIDVQSWYRAATTTRRYPPMPSGPDSTLSASYQILSAIRDKKISLEGLAAYLFDATYREAAVVSTYNFIVRPLLQGLLKKMIPVPSPTPFPPFLAKPEPGLVWEPIVRPTPIETSDTIIDSLAATYQDLLKQEYKATRYSKLVGVGLILLLISSVYAAVTVQQIISSRTAPWGLVTVILGELVFAVIFLRLANKYGLEYEKRLFMDVYDITTGLRDYRKNPSLTTELEVERLSELADNLENNWVVNFKLAKEVLSPVQDFVENLKERLIPAAEKGNTNDVDIGVSALARFSRLLLEEHPQIAELKKINDLMIPLSPTTIGPPKWRSRAITVLRNNPRVRWIEVVAACVIIGSGVDVIENYLGAPSWQSFLAGSTISTLLFVGYLTSPLWRHAIRKP